MTVIYHLPLSMFLYNIFCSLERPRRLVFLSLRFATNAQQITASMELNLPRSSSLIYPAPPPHARQGRSGRTQAPAPRCASSAAAATIAPPSASASPSRHTRPVLSRLLHCLRCPHCPPERLTLCWPLARTQVSRAAQGRPPERAPPHTARMTLEPQSAVHGEVNCHFLSIALQSPSIDGMVVCRQLLLLHP
jgi:hypothetical protein